MHELALTRSIVEQIAERMDGQQVVSVHLEIGKLSGVVADSVRFCFELVAAGTALEGSTLVIGEPPGRAHCGGCGEDFPVSDLLLLCPCGRADVKVTGGDELLIRSVGVL